MLLQKPELESTAPFTVSCSLLLEVALVEIFLLIQGDAADQTPVTLPPLYCLLTVKK